MINRYSLLSTFFALFWVLLMLWGCSDDESYKDDLIGTGEIGISNEMLSCTDAVYPNWETSKYNLPYPIGEVYPIGRGNCGDSYHGAGLPDQFGVDIDMPSGSQILATRPGSVIYVEERGQSGGYPNNVVVIRHSDGTYALYMHLQNNGATVEVGENVSRGELIGYSGNTGFAGYPHLHFVVVTPERFAYPYTSIPVTFKNTIANERSLLEGEFYPALPD